MPAYTSPDNIQYPVSTDQVAPLETVFANMAQSTQNAFDGFRIDWNDFEATRQIQTFRWADAAARAAQTGMVAGDRGYQIDTGLDYIYTGSAWGINTGGLLLIKSYSFSAASSLTVDDFSDAFPGYLLKIRAEFSAAAYLNAVLRAGGSDLTGANYDRQILQGSASAAASAGATGQTSANFITFAARDRISVAAEITGAREAIPTMIEASGSAHGGGLIVGRYTSVYTPTTIIDGIKFSPNTGTMTGTLDVYGYVR